MRDVWKRALTATSDALFWRRFMADQSPHEKSLWNVVGLGTAISFGILGAIIGSMKGFFQGDVTFTLSAWTIIGFVIGVSTGWLLWKLVRRQITKSGDGP